LFDILKKKFGSERRASDLLKVDRTTMRYEPRPERQKKRVVRIALEMLREDEPRYGIPRLEFLVNQMVDAPVNHKMIESIRREMGWQPSVSGRHIVTFAKFS